MVSPDLEVSCTRSVYDVALHHFADLTSGLGFTTELCNVHRKVTGEQHIRNILEGSSHVLIEVLSLHFVTRIGGSQNKAIMLAGVLIKICTGYLPYIAITSTCSV
jgi:hypothetical protein